MKLKNKQQQRNKGEKNRGFRSEKFSIESSRSKLKTKVIGNFHDSVILTQLPGCSLLTDPSLLNDNHWRTLRTKTNQRTDREQLTRSMLRLPGYLYRLDWQKLERKTDWTETSNEKWWHQQSTHAEHLLQTNHTIDRDSAKCVTYCTNYHQRIALESWFTNLEQTRLNCCQQLLPRRKRVQLIKVIFARILVGVESGIYGGIFFKLIVRFY